MECAVAELSSSVRGRVIAKSNADYDEARKLYNGMIDKSPHFIVSCADVADVVHAVRFGVEHQLLTAIRSGGHNGPGLGSCNDGLVIDLSGMKGIQINLADRKVVAQAGCTQGDLDHATHPFGLGVPTGIVSTTGLGGLTLGGGHGYLSRKHGLTIDNLVEADVVLADGSLVTASASQNSDLFWAIRGGGGNFGVVTSFTFQAHPVSTIYGGLTFWDISHGREVMHWYSDFLKAAPEELCPFLGLKHVPAAPPFPESIQGQQICALISCFNGSKAEGEKAHAPLSELPAPTFQHIGEMPFPMLQGLFDELLPSGLQWYWKGDFFPELTSDAIDLHLEHTSRVPNKTSFVHLYPIDGAVQRVAPSDTAWNCRNATWSMVIAGLAVDPSENEAVAKWAKEYWQALHPHSTGAAYVNFLMDEGHDRIKSTYGENYNRLREVKRKYDPTNFFRVNQNIEPA